MRTIEATRLGNLIEALCTEVSTALPADVVAALETSREEERSPLGRRALDMILENAVQARDLGLPICQDTGLFTIYISLGRDTVIAGDLTHEASAAVARATARAALRSSIVADPIDGRVNTGDNTPPLIEVELGEGEDTTLGVLAKGGGSEMASRSAMLPRGAGWEGVRDYVLSVVSEVGARSCPPLVLGLGIGGSFDRAPAMAKRSLLAPLDVPAREAATRARERELIDAVNKLGIGPGAMGGTFTCMGARITTASCHIANLPVAVSVNCHALRRKVAIV